MSDALALAVRSFIFGVRNFDKAENQGKVGRIAPAIGQANKTVRYVVDNVRALDKGLEKGAKAAANIWAKAAEGEKLLQYAGEAVDFASRNVNPLICISSGIDVLR